MNQDHDERMKQKQFGQYQFNSQQRIKYPFGQSQLRQQDMPAQHNNLQEYLSLLEGSFEINGLIYLQSDYFRFLILLTLILASGVGILFLLFSFKVRKYIRFNLFTEKLTNENISNLTHVSVVNANQEIAEQIVKVKKINHPYLNTSKHVFIYHNLRYEINLDQRISKKCYLAVGFHYVGILKHTIKQIKHNQQKFQHKIFSQEKIQELRKYYGKNSHPIKIPSYFTYIWNTMTQIFFFFQYFVCILYIAEGTYIFAIVLLATSLLSVSVIYILMYLSFQKLKIMAQNTQKTLIFGRYKGVKITKTMKKQSLVPGDIIILKQNDKVPCDAILISGKLQVNEVDLTGENRPIDKESITEQSQVTYKIGEKHWVFEDTVITKINKPYANSRVVLAMVINTGYTTRRGSLIRKLIPNKHYSPQFFRSLLVFSIELLIFGIFIYLVTLKILLDAPIQTTLKALRFLDTITYCIPPPLLIFISLSYACCLYRLRNDKIEGTQPTKTAEAAKTSTIYFDKTGTLTELDMKIDQIYQTQKYTRIIPRDEQEVISDQTMNENIKESLRRKQHVLIRKIFATCHNMKQQKNLEKIPLDGDEIDKRMFQASNCTIVNDNDKLSKCQLVQKQIECRITAVKESSEEDKIDLEVIKTNQYQSENMSMHAIVFDRVQKQIYLFCKGALEKLQSSSRNDIDPNLIKEISHNGRRVLMFGFKRIKNEKELQRLLKQQDLTQVFRGIELNGFVVFENKLKSSAIELMEQLSAVDIETRMITGDNIYNAIYISTETHIILPSNTAMQLIDPLNVKGLNIYLIDGLAQALDHSSIKVQTVQHGLLEKTITLSDFLNDPGYKHSYLAVDQDFIHQYQTFILRNQENQEKISEISQIKSLLKRLFLEKIKIFARISSKNKAKIIKIHKQLISQNYQKDKALFKDQNDKIMMVGDGLNDLLAIKQADIGVRISSDSIYTATFTINELSKIIVIINEGKNTFRQIIQIVQFFCLVSFINCITSIIITVDGTYESNLQSFYQVFSLDIPFVICLCLSQAKEKQLSKESPNFNFMSGPHHLVFWGNCIFMSLTYTAGYLYYINSEDFTPNSQTYTQYDSSAQDLGYNTATKSSTVMFFMMMLWFNGLGFIVYQSKPWKKQIYTNIPLIILLIVNSIVSLAFFFISDFLSALNCVPIDSKNSALVLIITLTGIALCWFYNFLIEKYLASNTNNRAVHPQNPNESQLMQRM